MIDSYMHKISSTFIKGNLEMVKINKDEKGIYNISVFGIKNK